MSAIERESSARASKSDYPLMHSIVALVVGAFASTFVVWSSSREMGSGVFFSWDSASYIAQAQDAMRNSTLTLGPSLLQSFGNIQYPDNFFLLPEFLLSHRTDEVDPAVFYAATAALFFCMTFFLLRAWSFPLVASQFAAITFVLATLPIDAKPILSTLYWWHSPYSNQPTYLVGLILIAVSLFVLRPPSNLFARMLLLAFVALSVLYAASAKIAQFPFLLPPVLLFLAAIFFTLESSQKRRFWIASFTLVAAITPGLIRSRELVETYGNWLGGQSPSPFGFFWPLSAVNAWQNAGTYWSPLLTLVFVGAGLIWASAPSHSVLWKSRGLGVFVGSTAIFYMFPLMGAIYANYIAFLYLAAVCAAALRIWEIIGSKWRIRNSASNSTFVLKQSLVISIAVFLFVFLAPAPPMGFGDSSKGESEVMKEISWSIRFNVGDKFRGRLLADIDPSRSDTLSAAMAQGIVLNYEFGNDFVFAGPQHYGIPVAVEDNRLNGAAGILFSRLVLQESPNVSERIDFRYPTTSDQDWLRFIGIRFVFLQGASMQDDWSRVVRTPTAQTIAGKSTSGILVDLETPNIGDYSPNDIRVAPDFSTMRDILLSRSFNPRRQAVVSQPFDGLGDLVIANHGIITRIPNGINVKSTSTGNSFLVLPFEFSRCWKVTSKIDGVTPQVIRTNIAWIGVSFRHEVNLDLKMEFLPWERLTCRNDDLRDLSNLGIDSTTLQETIEFMGGKPSLISGWG